MAKRRGQSPPPRPTPSGRRGTRSGPAANWSVFARNLDVTTRDPDLERAAVLLKEMPLFRHLSRRFLIDVAERSVAGRLRDTGAQLLDVFVGEEIPPNEIIDGPTTTRGQILAIVVLKGTLIVANTPPANKRRAPIPSPLPSPLPDGVTFAFELTPGGYPRAFDVGSPTFGTFRLEPAKGQEVELLVVSTGDFKAPAPAWGLDKNGIVDRKLAQVIAAQQRPELIWVAAAGGNSVPAEALLHALGGKIAQNYENHTSGKEPAALVTLGNVPETLKWIGTKFDDAKTTLPSMGVTPDDLYALVGGKSQRGRVFVLNKSDTMTRPARLQGVLFDRVIYLSDEIPPAVPKAIDPLIDPDVKTEKGDGTYFSSFIPSISPGFAPTTIGAKTKKFKSGRFCRKKKAGNTPEDETMMAFMRCVRDAAVVEVDTAALAQTWADWQANGGTGQPQPFHAAAIGSGAISEEMLDSWGRAVTNRRVGVACSGGGASAYRMGPILKEMETQGIPVDVFAGLSGGALVGAFYSRYGMPGFEFARCLGPFFQLTLPFVLLWTRPWECVMDFFLDGARVEDLGVRFAAVAAALPEEDPPSATVVLHGSLGEAIRVSGSLPPTFAPSDKNGVRYTDGGAATAVPAQVARDCGADVVLAVNVIPGPARGNPFSGLPLGWLIRKTPFIGRSIDNYTWYAFFMEQTSYEFGRSADEFIDFQRQDFPMFESTAFIAANYIVGEAKKEQAQIAARINALLNKWQAL